MKAVLVVLILGVVVFAQMSDAKVVPPHSHSNSESEESHESHDVATELAEIKHELRALEKRFLDLGLFEAVEEEALPEEHSSEKKHGKMSRREKEINKKSLGDIFNWLGSSVFG